MKEVEVFMTKVRRILLMVFVELDHTGDAEHGAVEHQWSENQIDCFRRDCR